VLLVTINLGARTSEKPGLILPTANDSRRRPAFKVDLPLHRRSSRGSAVPVHINSVVTELGTMDGRVCVPHGVNRTIARPSDYLSVGLGI
jgi:hypothetical protein